MIIFEAMMRMKKLIFLLLVGFVCLSSSSFMPHPYHVGSVELNYNSRSKTMEVTGRFFMDDLEDALNAHFKRKFRFMDKSKKTEIEVALKKYLQEHLKVRINNQNVTLHYLGHQEERESVELFLESSTLPLPKKVETSVSCLYNLYDDQMNIVHVILNGKRKTAKANYPDRYLKFEF